MWYDESVFYQIYPLGFCDAPTENDGIYKNRIKKVVDWIPHIKKVGCMRFIFRLFLILIIMVMTQEIIKILTADLVITKTLRW